MSKFNEILNSSNPSDALLGEQIDKINTEVYEQRINSYLVIRRHGRTVTINGYMGNIDFSKGTVTIGKINDEIGVPTTVIRTLCNCGSNAYTVGTLGYMVIDASGTINVTSAYTGTSGAIYVSCSYTI